MPIPEQDIFPQFKADLTTDRLRILQAGHSGGATGLILHGLNVTKLNATTIRVSPGVVVKDDVIVSIRQHVDLTIPTTGTREILLEYVHADLIPQPQASIDVHLSGTYSANPSRYIYICKVVNGDIVEDHGSRHVRPLIYVYSVDPAGLSWLQPILSDGHYWLRTTDKKFLLRKEGTWVEVLDFDRVSYADYASDADKLDGQHGTYYLARANHTGTQPPSTISPQGAGSGLDADKLDGQHGTHYLARANHTGTQSPSTISPQGHDSGLNADMLDGYHASQTPTASTIPVADGSGKLDAGWLPTTGLALFQNRTEFTSSTTWTVPEGVYVIGIELVGGGGGGGGGGSTVVLQCSGGGGGGASGGYIPFCLVKVSPGTILTIGVGAGGGGGSGAPDYWHPFGTSGGSGGSSFVSGFSSYIGHHDPSSPQSLVACGGEGGGGGGYHSDEYSEGPVPGVGGGRPTNGKGFLGYGGDGGKSGGTTPYGGKRGGSGSSGGGGGGSWYGVGGAGGSSGYPHGQAGGSGGGFGAGGGGGGGACSGAVGGAGGAGHHGVVYIYY